jgi:hypothetical protein
MITGNNHSFGPKCILSPESGNEAAFETLRSLGSNNGLKQPDPVCKCKNKRSCLWAGRVVCRKDLQLMQTSQAIYNSHITYIEAPSCNHCWRGKANIITPTACGFVAVVIQNAIRVRHIVVCGLHGYKIFFHINSKIFEKKQPLIDGKICVSIFFTKFVWNIYHSKKKWARYDKNWCCSSF